MHREQRREKEARCIEREAQCIEREAQCIERRRRNA